METPVVDYRRCDLPENVYEILDRIERLPHDDAGRQNPVHGFEIPFSTEQFPDRGESYSRQCGPKWWKDLVNISKLVWSIIRRNESEQKRSVMYVDDMNPPPSYCYLSKLNEGTSVRVSIILCFGSDNDHLLGCTVKLIIDDNGRVDMESVLYDKTEIDEYTIKCICAHMKTF